MWFLTPFRCRWLTRWVTRWLTTVKQFLNCKRKTMWRKDAVKRDITWCLLSVSNDSYSVFQSRKVRRRGTSRHTVDITLIVVTSLTLLFALSCQQSRRQKWKDKHSWQKSVFLTRKKEIDINHKTPSSDLRILILLRRGHNTFWSQESKLESRTTDKETHWKYSSRPTSLWWIQWWNQSFADSKGNLDLLQIIYFSIILPNFTVTEGTTQSTFQQQEYSITCESDRLKRSHDIQRAHK